MCTFGNIGDSQRMLKKKESRTIPKVRILVESHTANHLKTFRIISGEMPVSLFILC